MGRWSILNPLVASLIIGTATQVPAGTSCKPLITFKEVRFSKRRINAEIGPLPCL